MATYYFDEIINLINSCETKEELNILAGIIEEEKKQYSLRVLKEINTRFILKRVQFNFTGF